MLLREGSLDVTVGSFVKTKRVVPFSYLALGVSLIKYLGKNFVFVPDERGMSQGGVKAPVLFTIPESSTLKDVWLVIHLKIIEALAPLFTAVKSNTFSALDVIMRKIEEEYSALVMVTIKRDTILDLENNPLKK